MSKQILLNLDWRFHLGDAPGADFMGYDDQAWRRVTLPHDWSVEHPFDPANASGTGYLPGGTAWYRRSFTLPEQAAGMRARLCFGGVYKHSQVWVNSNYLGGRASGYSSFSFDVSDFVRPGENVVCVRVEHEQVADSRWFTGSGIYRDVTLTLSDPCSFTEHGLFAHTLAVDGNGAQVAVDYETTGGEGARFALIDGQGRAVAEARADQAAGRAVLQLPQPRLWSPDNPYLYTLKAEALRGGAVTDERTVSVGVRTFRFDPDQGFFLNGENLKLKGVCVHHDAGALGAAVPRCVWARRLEKLKAAGCNALRTAHNPPDTHLLDLCDEMGLMVMDEAFDEWEGAKNKWWQGHNVYPPKRFGYAEDFPQWHEQDLTGMVLRDRNHPCVILWSIGNEIDYPNDPYVHPLFSEVMGNNDANKPAAERQYDPRKPDAGRLAVISQRLADLVRTCDDTRPVTSALAFPELSNRTGYAQTLDVVGYNYKEPLYEQDHAQYPAHVIYGSENSHAVSAWQAVAEHPYICGQFLWTGIDFLGEAHGWPVRCSQAGMLTTAGFEKPLYYQRKALWTDAPFARIAVGRGKGPWDERFAWDGAPGEALCVSVYTNQPEAELFLDGASLGKRAVGPERRATWEAPYAPGSLRAVVPGAEDTLTSAGPAASIALTPDSAALPADGQSVWQVEITLLDEEGRVAASSDDWVAVQLVGDGRLLGLENGLPDDLTPYAEPCRRVSQGRLIAYVRAGARPGPIALHAATRAGLRAEITLQAQ
ncbi:MAG: sugar-binding domain-containing protein [Christensenellales bacterium]|jgi:beta-galactosidase